MQNIDPCMVVDEIALRDKKKLNLMMFRVKEAMITIEDSTEKARHDMNAIKAVLNAIGLAHEYAKIGSFERVGNFLSHDRPRPILLEFLCPLARDSVLASAKKLKDTHLSDVAIHQDETYMQRAHRKKLREECSELNKNLPQADVQGNVEWRVLTKGGRAYRAKVPRRSQPPRGPQTQKRQADDVGAEDGGQPANKRASTSTPTVAGQINGIYEVMRRFYPKMK